MYAKLSQYKIAHLINYFDYSFKLINITNFKQSFQKFHLQNDIVSKN